MRTSMEKEKPIRGRTAFMLCMILGPTGIHGKLEHHFPEINRKSILENHPDYLEEWVNQEFKKETRQIINK